jgi:hypothetical protein
MNSLILSNSQSRQRWNKKKAINRSKKKVRWDQLQIETQGFEEVCRPLLVGFIFNKILGIIGRLMWGVGFIPLSASHELRRMMTLWKKSG